jgi:DNA-binding transcriptional LysR family regulator
MSLLNYTHLRAFRAVAAEGNLTRAAEKLGVAQSAVSTQIKALEARLGHALFERRGRSMALTEAGRIAFDCADRAFAAGDELVETLAGRSGAGQVIRVGALATLSRNFQLNFLRPLVQDPDVSVILRSGSIGELLGELEALRLDVVLTNAPPRHDAATPWREHRIDDQPVSLVGHPARPISRRRPGGAGGHATAGPAGGRERAARRFRPAHGARGPFAQDRGGSRRHGDAASSGPGGRGARAGAAHRRSGRIGGRYTGGGDPSFGAARGLLGDYLAPPVSEPGAGARSFGGLSPGKEKRARGAFSEISCVAGWSGRFGLRLAAPFAFLAAQRDGRADPGSNETHQPLHHALVGIDPGAAQHFAPIARTRPARDLIRTVAVFLVIGNRVIEGSKDHCREEFPRPLTLFEVEGGAINEIPHFVVLCLYCSCIFRRGARYAQFQCRTVMRFLQM